MKKLIAMLLCLSLVLLSGCGAGGEFYQLLTPGDADLRMAPNVILEPDEPPYNLGSWMEGDDVWWDMILPRKDTYTIRFWYSMPSDYEPCTAWLAVIPVEDQVVHTEPVFVPTSASGGWESYDYLDVTMDLPKGDVSLSLETFELPEGQDYFLNLRAVEVFTGELAPVEPGIMEVLPDVPEDTGREPFTEPVTEPMTEPVEEPEADGSWWVCSGGMPDDGLGLGDALFMNVETWLCEVYNEYGDLMDSYPFVAEDDRLTLDLGGMGEITYLVEDDCLVDADYGTVDFEWVEEPEFLYRPDFNGTWYRCGDPQNPSYYEIEDGIYRKLLRTDGEPIVEEEVPFAYGTTNHYINDLIISDVPHFLMEGSSEYYPVMDGAAFFVEEDMGYKAYVSERASDPEYVWAWMAVEDLMNSGALGTASDGTELLLHFEGFGFYVTMFSPDGERLDGAPHGSWLLREDGYMELESTDGDWIEFPIPENGDTILFPFQGEDVVLTVTDSY